ncbi:cysteine--tRNA ligase [Promethearchaeum syntrophicum]|uniref:Cysteine--tRNA ligase n=1 Tax=Promethearchaeum syntrophicum TaxID=2594042 RepID=A0A5B9DDW1_9ARCH|nr:cysteine--tRNA ligase [Candidatus Prometheoarchaeum syntrophicum]QEE17438.1 cysteinyl-tRNA synthetase [Candidatus Prometheoarchaeum syntrophicum]
MTLELFNTMGRRKEVFHPIHKEYVGIYCCGPTVYDYQHIGNLRTYIFEDILLRILHFNGYSVKHVMNITDVGHLTSDADVGEDKLMRSIRKLGLDPSVETMLALAKKYEIRFFEDCAKLNIITPTVICKASEHVPDMIEFIKRIEKMEYTYPTSVGLIFNSRKFVDYTKLAKLNLDNQKAGARVKIDPERKNPSDFALWVSNQPSHIMQWDSPWGRGFPGWHIECSAMSIKYLGDQFDIHCGGIDHIPVHHTNEIAQSESATGKKWVNYWLHGEFLVLDKEKMSKSQGSFIILEDIESKKINPLAYRYMCLTAHYRSALSFSWKNLEMAQQAYMSLKNRVQLAKDKSGTPNPKLKEEFSMQFLKYINSDMNLPQALGLVWTMLKSDLNGEEKLALVSQFDQVLGLNLIEEEFISEEAENLIKAREKAREEKNWQKSDMIRDQLQEMGVLIEDTPKGTRWKLIQN